MSTRVTAVVSRAARALVRIVLRAHPHDFRGRFQVEILSDVTADIRAASSGGSWPTIRAGTTAVIDAVITIRTIRTHYSIGQPRERLHMRTWIRDGWHDVRMGLRGFRRERVFSLSIVGTLALGIGVNAAMFGVTDRLLLRGPEHIRDAERVRRIQIALQPTGRDLLRTGWLGYVTYAALRQGRTFEAVAAYNVREDGTILGRGPEARRINSGEATSSLFPLLGAAPALGRFYNEKEDDTATPERVVVIGHGLWQREFGGRHDAIGAPIILDNTTYTIVGVTPDGFTGPDLTRVDVWFPESLIGRRVVTNWTQSFNGSWLSILVRLKPGVANEQADAEATAIYRGAYSGPDTARANATLTVQPLLYTRDGIPSLESRVSLWLTAVAGIVLLVACANIVNLMLAQGLTRRREIAVRLALGAGRGRLLRLLIAETLTLAIAGGAAALAIAWCLGTLMRSWLIPSVAWPSGPVNLRVLVLCTLLSLIVGVLVGLFPALRASSPDVSASLKTGVREGGGRRSGVRTGLTIVQAALCALLLVGSGLFVVSLSRVRALDLGLEPDRVLMFSVTRAGIATIQDEAERQRERDRRLAFYPMVVERLRQRGDIEATSLTIGLAFNSGFGEDIRVPGRETIPQLKGGGPYLSAVAADYFRTVGTRIIRGRPFSTDDRAGSPAVAIVNETMAATLWPGEEAIGRCFHVSQSPACAEIVGIAANARQFKLQEAESMAFYIPFGQEQGIGGTQLLVRPRGDADRVLAAVRQELMRLDPTIIFVSGSILQDSVNPQLRPWRLGATMFSLMGVLALVVAAIGLYSLMSYFVTYRTREIGVRMALGARPSDVARLVVNGGVSLVLAGIAAGFVLALIAARFIEPLLFQTSPRDPAVFAVVAATLVVMALFATLIPATRARRVNPIEAMRVE